MQSVNEIVRSIAKLPEDWHLAGTVNQNVLEAMLKHMNKLNVLHSMETGSGKTTLLFSNISKSHKVFAIEGDNGSITNVRKSSLFNSEAVEFIEGPTQLTLPVHTFENKLQVAFIDGPHGYPFPELEYLYIYPHLDENALLIVDDIHIPTIHRLFEFLKEDDMFTLLEVVEYTAFFTRTSAPPFDPHGDGWWLQQFNKKRYPIESTYSTFTRIVKSWLPLPLKNVILQVLGKKH